jgi:hypothetical protein
MQSYLEKKGIDARNDSLVRNDYDKSDIYSSSHKDSISDGDSKGKGTLHGGHTHTSPDFNRPSTIDYSSFDTNNGGNSYDIDGYKGKGGRNFLTTISKYNKNNEYGVNSIDTSANLADGQIII